MFHKNIYESKNDCIVMTTYVFDFYNLYIPKGMKYINNNLGIKIFPLKLAEEFEKNRESPFSQYSFGGWKTARCHIKSNSEDEAKQIALWLEFIYSFAQNRNVYFLKWYKYKKGSNYYLSQSKFIQQRENRFPDLIHCPLLNGRRIPLPLPIRVTSIEEALGKVPFYNRDISLFVNTSLKTLRDSDKSKQGEIIGAIHGYIISNSKNIMELKYLMAWMVIEQLADSYYKNVYKSKNKLFDKDEIKIIKASLENKLESILGGEYLFSWDEIPGNDSVSLIEILTQKFGIGWVKTAKIEKIDDDKTIKVSTDKNYLSLKLNDKKTEINLEIDDVRTDELVVKKEYGRLNIYGRDKRLIKKSINWNFLNEYNTFQKVSLYLESLDLGFDNEELKTLLPNLYKVRNRLVHSLKYDKKNRIYYSQLNKIVEQVIFRLLGIDKRLEKKFKINQFDKPTKVSNQTKNLSITF